MGAKHTLENMKAHPKAKQFQDFREMFEKAVKDFDAVSIGTPDFSHFPITILAMSLGKHVYVEKPLTRTFNESELLIKAEKKYKVATQMGNQGSALNGLRRGVELVHAGVGEEEVGGGGHEGGGRDDGVSLVAEEGEEAVADFGGSHGCRCEGL